MAPQDLNITYWAVYPRLRTAVVDIDFVACDGLAFALSRFSHLRLEKLWTTVLVVASNRGRVAGTIVDDGERSRDQGECCEELHCLDSIMD